MNKLLPLLTTLVQVARPWRPGAVVLIAILAAVLFNGPPAKAQSGSAGEVEMGLAQVGIEVSAVLYDDDRSVSNEAWQWRRSATEAGAYSDIPASEGGTSNPYTPSAGDLGMWLKAKVTYDDATGTGQTAESRPQPVLSQPVLSNASFAYYNELGYVYDVPVTHRYAQGFTTGSDTSGYLLTAVRLALFVLGGTAAGTWAVHADDAGKPAAAPLSAARPILNVDIPDESFTFAEFTHPDGVQLGPDTKYWIVISQTTPNDDGVIVIHAWGEWSGALEAGLATAPVDPGSEDGWSVDFTALTYYWDDPDDDKEPSAPELLPWQTFAFGLELPGRFVLRMALRVVPEVTVQFAQDSYAVAEGGTQSVTVTLSADPDRTLTIPITATGQSGATSTDYSPPASVTFNAGETSKSLTFTATQDTVDDDGESVRLGFGTMPDAWVSAGTRDETTVSITDDDHPEVEVSFGTDTYTAHEGGTVSVSVTLSADPERRVVVPLVKTGQGEVEDGDYSGVPNEVTFNSGQTSMSFTFTATQDDVDDDDESVRLSFGAMPDARVTPGTTNEATVSIADDDDPFVMVQFGADAYTVPEGGTQSVTVNLSANPERTVVIPLTAMPQGGADTTDYSVPLSVTFNANETSKTITFSATHDTEDDDDESVKLGFGTSLPARVTVGTRTETTLNIGDDDDPAVTVAFAQGSYTVAEGGAATVTVTLSADPERTVVIPLVKTNQGATDDDYSGVPSTVTFNATETVQSFTFAATQDDVDDDDESVRLTFGAMPDARVSPGTTDAATVTIDDDDDPFVRVMFSQDAYTAHEGGTVSVSVTLSADPERRVVIPLVKTGQGEVEDGDYSGVPNEVTFNSGQTSMSFTFTATQDDVDDDDEGVRLTFGAMPDARVTPGTTNEATVNIADDDDPFVTVQIAHDTYIAPEGGTTSVSVTLSADPERRVVIPLVKTDQGTTTTGDYSGVPDEVTFNSGQTSMSFTFAATQDEVDDDDESVRFSFGPMPDARVSPGTTDAATVRIADDDDPFVTVMFAQSAYRAVEGSTVTVRVTLNADPERRVVIPLVAAGQDGATSADYSGVPSSITINDGEMSKTFDFMATADDDADTGESVKLSIGTNLPSRVTEGTPNEATVVIKQVSTLFGLDCAGAVWCGDVGFSDQTAEDWGRFHLQAGYGLDPPYSLSDDDFRFRGVDYTVRRIKLQPGTHPVLPNAWSRWHQGYSYFSIHINSGYRGWRPAEPPEEHFRDWVLHVDGAELPFSDAFQYRDEFVWVGVEFQQIFNDWTTSTVTKIGIEEVAAADQYTRPATPWAPMQVDALPAGSNRLRISWTHPDWYYTGLPKPTSYIVQWKRASDSWSDSPAVSQREVAFRPGYFNHLLVDGLTDGVFYSVRVIASNAAGDGPTAEETLGRPGDSFPAPILLAKTVNGQTLTLHFSERLDGNSAPAKTDFIVMVDSGLRGVDSVAISGPDVILTLDRAVSAANAVLVRYEKPTDTSAAFLRAVDGNLVQIPKLSELLQVVNATPQSSVPLTAQFTNVPGSHDGSAPFTLNVEFSDSVWIGRGLARDDTLEVTGGTVTVAYWLDRRTDRWAFTIRPETGGDVVVAMPGGFCTVNYHVDDVAGAPCAVGDRTLTNRPTVTVPGPSSQQQAVENTPAEGEPRIAGTPEVGQTLSADTTGITDADGLDDVVFQYQWLADGAVIAGATGATYTVVSEDVGKAITVRVDFTDDAGNEETLTSASVVVTARLQLHSATVDGSTLTLTYNKELDNLVSVPSTAFAVNVNGAPRSVRGVGFGQSNVLLFLSSAVAVADAVTVDYTAPDGAGGIQDTLGRKADSFTGQVVANNTTPADAGRSDPAQTPGSPDSLEVVLLESGKLRASWDAPDSGPAPTGYTVQWKESGDDWADEDDVSAANVKETSHVIPGLTDGVKYAVRVIARKGDAESAPSGEITSTPQETEPPAPSSASVDGATLTITFDKPLDPGETPDKSAFAATVGGASQGLETVAVSGSGVTITLVTAVCAGDAVTVGYTAPADASAARLQDLAGNAAASFSEWKVTNNTGAAGQLTACARGVPASHDGSASFTFELRFSEQFSLSYKTLRDHAFTVTGGEVIRARRLERPGNIRWEITVRPSSEAAVTIVLPVTEDCEADGAICTGDGRKLSSRVELTISGPDG